jgi:hypothetical protein
VVCDGGAGSKSIAVVESAGVTSPPGIDLGGRVDPLKPDFGLSGEGAVVGLKTGASVMISSLSAGLTTLSD